MKKILIVDDEEAIRRLVMASLRKFDYQFLEAETGGRAVELVRSWQPDLVIMDLSMPASPVDGLEAIRQIRDSGCEGDCRILVVSGAFLDWDEARSLKAGAHAYLAKPFSPLELRAKVCELLQSPPKTRPKPKTT